MTLAGALLGLRKRIAAISKINPSVARGVAANAPASPTPPAHQALARSARYADTIRAWAIALTLLSWDNLPSERAASIVMRRARAMRAGASDIWPR
jgi:hypothetical protein